MRVDKLLWFLRLAASRSFAQQWVEAGHMRLNGRRVEKPSTSVNCGDILTLPMRTQVKVIALVSLPTRRGPASEAQSCYRVLDEMAENHLATDRSNAGTEGDLQP
jgi:ribosome-associated heat shock protein Hsp15